MSAIGPKRTFLVAPHMSAYDPKRTSGRLVSRLSDVLTIVAQYRCANGRALRRLVRIFLTSKSGRSDVIE